MKVFNFTLAFSVMAADEIDARLKLKELLKSISKEEILWAMALKEDDDAQMVSGEAVCLGCVAKLGRGGAGGEDCCCD